MAIVISKEKNDGTLIASVEKISGVKLNECLQCKKCSNGCPVAGITKTGPAEIIRRLQLNTGAEILESDLVWMCVSCETCFGRCPMKIDMAAIMDALRNIAVKKKSQGHNGNVHLFNTSFLSTVSIFGRTYDLGMIAAFKIRTSRYMQDTEKFPMMLKKGKIALLPSFKADKKYIKRIFKNKKDIK
ncbi:MAG TPA: 4Fe-4S dicluster domain-containing protein [Bacteroidales bacterium]|jgi:heterodisulfide reductase subunit C|nr:4Fe-4S dicluster domain-containing protein [Bacteroidales bacterium]